MKTNMKKLFSILLVVIMVIGLSACGDQNNDGNNVVDDVEDGVNDVVDGVENGVNDMLLSLIHISTY